MIFVGELIRWKVDSAFDDENPWGIVIETTERAVKVLWAQEMVLRPFFSPNTEIRCYQCWYTFDYICNHMVVI